MTGRSRRDGKRRARRNRWRAVAVALVVAVVAVAVGIAVGMRGSGHSGATTTATAPTTAPTTTATAPPPPRAKAYAVGVTTIHLVDPSRTVRLRNGTRVPRSLNVIVRYPTKASPGGVDVPNASPDRSDGPYPLVVFGHGFNISTAPYAALLRSWVKAGYVVAAPIFPLEQPNAPGGPNETDLVNQPADMSLVITQLTGGGQEPSSLKGLVDKAHIAVAGHSDGGDTALAVADDPRYRDGRVDAVMVFSGAYDPYVSPFRFPPNGPPLLAVQGTADAVNPSALTRQFYLAARPPKYLLTLFGAPHLPPYSYEQPQLSIVERTTVAFLRLYLGNGTVSTLRAVGTVAGVSHLAGVP
jgi:dienelactone hydrolase